MNKAVKRFIVAVVALAAALPCAISPVFANSGPRYEQGVTASGAIVQGEKSALAVESEKLTFDIKDFPAYGGGDNYKSTVTAEYKFVNTSENTVRTSMAFPLGRLPDYFAYTESAGAFSAKITVDGKEVAAQTRHTYGNFENFSESVKLIGDEWYSDDFYSADLKVTEYSVDMSTGGYSYAYAVGSVEGDPSKARVFSDVYSVGTMRYYFEKSQQPVTPYVQGVGGTQYFYVLGDETAFSCGWHAEIYGRNGYKRVDLPVTVKKTRETTLKEFVPELRDKNSVISDLDFYNGVVRQFTSDECVLDWYNQLYGFSDEDFLVWYTYDVEVAAGGSVENSVTAPIFPSIDYSYNPNVFGYEYYLSPAALWQSFGGLEIVINTDYYLTKSSVSFDKEEGAYVARLDGLPAAELSFSLCSEPDPEYERNPFGVAMVTVLLIFLFVVEFITAGAVIFAIVYLVKSRKRKS